VTGTGPANPFVLYRTRLASYALARDRGWTDADFVSTVTRLDKAVEAVAGTGFRVTPLTPSRPLAEALGLGGAILHVKDETANVSGSHKARHLFGTLLDEVVRGAWEGGELAIASCGNAAVAAAVVAAAVGRSIRVFIPTWADHQIVSILERLGAHIEVCERRPGEEGDPAYLRFTEAVASGAVPFSVQSTLTPTTIDGGRTVGWEIADQLPGTGPVRLFVQVGGGALASAVESGMAEGLGSEPVLHAVQTEACAPLDRAWRELTGDVARRLDVDLPVDASARARVFRESRPRTVETALAVMETGTWMRPWEKVGTSAATGILDDVTYDWRTVVGPMLRTAGWPIVVSEEAVIEANRLGRRATGIDADPTGTAGVAGLLDDATVATIRPVDRVVVLFTGVVRGQSPPTP